MGFMDYFRSSKKNSAGLAKERLQIIVAHSRSERRSGCDQSVNLQALQKKLIDVISEFLHINEDEFKVELERDDVRSVFELNVTLPDSVDAVAEER